MPKKFLGENTKAAEAKARKAARQEEEAERKKQAEEDAFWKDDDKHIQKKLQRKEDKQKKQQEIHERKAINKQLADQEIQAFSHASKNQSLTQKVTRAELLLREERLKAEKEHEEATRKLQAQNISLNDDLLLENVNRLNVEGDEARTVDEALKVLGSTHDVADRNPEKRLLSSYLSFEEKNLPRLKAENPNLRLSQLKQMLKKEWQKSPENPMNAGI